MNNTTMKQQRLKCLRVFSIVGVYLKTQMEVAIKIETDDRENDKHRSNLAIEKSCYDDLGVQRKWNTTWTLATAHDRSPNVSTLS